MTTVETITKEVDRLTDILLAGGSISDGSRLYGQDDIKRLMAENSFSEWESAHTLSQSVWLIRINDGRESL